MAAQSLARPIKSPLRPALARGPRSRQIGRPPRHPRGDVSSTIRADDRTIDRPHGRHIWHVRMITRAVVWHARRPRGARHRAKTRSSAALCIYISLLLHNKMRALNPAVHSQSSCGPLRRAFAHHTGQPDSVCAPAGRRALKWCAGARLVTQISPPVLVRSGSINLLYNQSHQGH